MNYIKEVKRTESEPTVDSISRLTMQSRAVHAFFGLLTETGEIADGFKRHLFYGQPLDVSNIVEEVGDVLWYLAILLDHCGVDDFDACMEANIRKLRKRYPEKFSEFNAAEENRDRRAEREAAEYREETGIKREVVEPPFKAGSSTKAEVEARRISKNHFICPHCGGHINDEVVRKLHSPSHHSKVFLCPNCKQVLLSKDLKCIDRPSKTPTD